MAHSFKSDTAKRAATLIAGALACEWCGVEAEAKDLRGAFANTVFEFLLRIDAATKGQSSENLIRLIKAFGANIHADQSAIEGGGGKEAAAVQQFVKWLCGFLPADLRSLDAIIRSADPGAKQAGPATPTSTGTPAATPRPMTKEARERAKLLQSALLPVAIAAGGWPSVPKLGKEIEKRLKMLRKGACISTLADIAIWMSCVPLQAASSQVVALAIKAAFEAVRLSPVGSMGLVKSGRDLGTVVHENFSQAAARDFCLSVTDRILVAEYSAYVPPSPVARPVATVETAWQRISKDYSLTVLAQSRGSLGGSYVRRAGSKTSRDDLVVFRGLTGTAASGLLGLEARPEVYELKPVDSVVSAVSQVTAYSWNYLVASIYLQCTLLPRIPGSRISNSVMLPASPEDHAIRLPLLTITELIETGAAMTSPGSAAIKIADIVQRLMSKLVEAGPYVAIPFMVSGLYGVIPYFVIDLKKIQQALKAVMAAIVEALIAALMAYLAAKKAFEEFIEKFGGILVTALIAIGLFLIIIGTLPAQAVAVLVTAAILVIVFVSDSDSPESSPGGKDREPLNIYLGAMALNGITAEAFASWMAQVRTVFEDMWSADVDRSTINVEPLL